MGINDRIMLTGPSWPLLSFIIIICCRYFVFESLRRPHCLFLDLSRDDIQIGIIKLRTSIIKQVVKCKLYKHTV